MKPFLEHIYIHVPFCTHICPYCAFYKTRNLMSDMKPFIPALRSEIEWAQGHFQIAPRTVYFGGGTPSALSVSQLEALFANWPWSEIEEFTMECNPETITERKAALLKDVGVNRISLGVQAFDEASLKMLGRTHKKEGVQKSMQILREVGFENTSIDLMFALPGQAIEAWEHSITEAMQLKPEHISCYNLNYEEDTEFFERFAKGEYQLDEEQEKHFFYRAIELLIEGGYEQYEISNYAQQGFESLHNVSCWEGKDYLGLGPSACSTIGLERWKNVESIHEYAQGWQFGERQGQSEKLNDQLKSDERIILGLRTRRGIHKELLEGKRELSKALVEEGLLSESDNRFMLTDRGKLVADSVTELLVRE